MKIHGLMKMTLLDFPGKVACTVFLGGCDFRCPFCHNWELLDPEAPAFMEDTELLRFLDTRHGLLDGVVFTGGEPLLRRELPDLIRSIRGMGFQVKLDTNGNHPDRLIELVEEGLVDYVAMDIKNCRERYGETIGIPNFNVSKINQSVEYLLGGKVDYEFRTTVVSQFHDEESMKKIGEWIHGADRYFLQGFVSRETVPDKELKACSKEQMNAFLDIVSPCVKEAALRGI
ncbi:MAG: anaerobic ribonucleoside-triphosphate reductase activating protein [Clostridiales bacterium]|nr:anaerobic ribonucleoside-triphosphate reductase activating protein [Clostridiales bacterium]